MKRDSKQTQISPIETALQGRFGGISSTELGAAFTDAEFKRADWLVSAVLFGLKCLVAKSKIKQGDFWNFISKSIEDEDGKSLATARRYMGLALKVGMQIAIPDAENEIGARAISYFKLNKIKFGDLDVIFSKHETIIDILKYLLEGYSLRALCKALQGIDARLALEDNRQKKLGGELPKSSTPGQADFFALLDRDIFSIDEKIKSKELSRLPKSKVLAYADALIERGEKLRAAVENAPEED